MQLSKIRSANRSNLIKAGILLSVANLSYADDWTGTTSSDWFTPSNWSTGIPDSATDVTINAAASSPNLVTAGATANNVFIGSSSPSTLTLNSNGTLHSVNADIGYLTSGTVVVNGPRASWTNDNLLVVAQSANSSATLTLSSGGVVNSGSMSLGSQSLASGTVTLSDVGSAIHIINDLYVGENGSGTLVAGNGASLSSRNGYIGYGTSATGFVSIDGAGTAWQNSGNLVVGNNGSNAELDITNHGLVTDMNGVIGNNAGSSGIVNVSDPGSVWANGNSLTIGNAGTGALTLSSNALVTVAGAGQVTIGANSVLNIGADASSVAAQSGRLSASNVQMNGNGAIVFNHTDSNYLFSPTISGSGSVLQAGTGSTTLTGNNSYTGGTLVTAGTLQGTTNSLQGSIVDNSHVVFDQTSTGVFSGNISGSGDVTKNNTGTVFLTTANSQTGNFIINAGSVEISAEDNLGNGQALIFGTDSNNPTVSGELVTNHTASIARNIITTGNAIIAPLANTQLTLHSIAGSGNFIKAGEGVVTLSQAVGYTGSTSVQQGTLRAGVNNVLVSSPLLQIGSSGAFDANGLSQRVNSLANNGIVSLSNNAAGNTTFHTLTVANNLSGNGVIVVSSDLVSQSADLINVLGAATGQQQLQINNATQTTDPSPTSVVRLVQTTGGGNFFGSTDAGTFQFTVARGNGSAQMPDTNAFYLIFSPTLSATANAAIGLYSCGFYQLFADMQTLAQRLGELRLQHGSGVWFKPYDNRMTINNQASRQFDQNTGGFDIGIDKQLHALQGGDLYAGIYAGYLNADIHFHQRSSGAAQAFSFGAYVTWLHTEGWYVDAVAKYFRFWNDFHAYTSTGDVSTANYSVPAVAGSLESGKRFDLHFAKRSFFVEPQAQVQVGYIQGMHYVASNSLSVKGNDQFSSQLRVGARVGMHFDFINHNTAAPYLTASLVQRLSGRNTLATNSTSFTTVLAPTAGQIGAGASLQMSAHAYAYGEYEYVFARGLHEPFALSAGIRWAF